MHRLWLSLVLAALGATATLASPTASVEAIRNELNTLQGALGVPPEAELDGLRDHLYDSIQALASDSASYGGVPARMLAARFSLRAASLFLHRFGRVADAYDFGSDAVSIYEGLGSAEGALAAADLMAKLDDQLDSVSEGMRLYQDQFQEQAGQGTASKKGGKGKGKGTVGKKGK